MWGRRPQGQRAETCGRRHGPSVLRGHRVTGGLQLNKEEDRDCEQQTEMTGGGERRPHLPPSTQNPDQRAACPVPGPTAGRCLRAQSLPLLHMAPSINSHQARSLPRDLREREDARDKSVCPVPLAGGQDSGWGTRGRWYPGCGAHGAPGRGGLHIYSTVSHKHLCSVTSMMFLPKTQAAWP